MRDGDLVSVAKVIQNMGKCISHVKIIFSKCDFFIKKALTQSEGL